ncbi:Imm51 family immunity protein [Brachyspira intermedia]|uniref:Imm51 family immunity protein n=1 Tax=Brachyspira intermedia TaxID=84377 RepID=UPI0030050F39
MSNILDKKVHELKDAIDFDSEASMFCAYSSDIEALKKFALSFKEACEDDKLIRDLFSRAELD